MISTAHHITILTLICLAATASLATRIATTRQAQTEKDLIAAQQLQQRGEFEKATGLLEAQIERVAGSPEERQIRPQLNYALGYLYEQEAQKRPEDRNALLTQSEQCYQRVLSEHPGHEATTRSLALVYRQLGQEDQAIELLHGAVASGADRSGSLSMQLGNIYSARQTWASALTAYQGAAQKSTSEAPRRRIVQVYRQLPADQAQELLTILPQWEFQSPRVARMGYETVFARAREEDEATAEKSLYLWADMSARDGTISADDIGRLPGDWAPAAELQHWVETLQDPVDRELPVPLEPAHDPQVSVRRHVFARLALAFGTQHLDANRPEAAAAAWELGLAAAPDSEMHQGILQRYPTFDYVRADVLRELALLYFRQRDAQNRDAELDRLADLTDQLFELKTDAYAAQDLEAIQRLHTALGLIYAEMNTWQSSYAARNARFQLENALRTAEENEEQTDFYQPLAEISRRLADGLRSLDGQSRQEARRYYLKAATGYLDRDQLDKAGEMVSVARSLPPGDDALIQELQEILLTRGQLSRYRRRSADINDLYLELSTEGDHRWLRSGTRLRTDPRFAARQRFKLYADAAALIGNGNPNAARDLARTALGFARRGKTLVGAADLQRLEKIAALAQRDSSVETWVETRRTKPQGSGGTVWPLFLPGQFRPMFAVLHN